MNVVESNTSVPFLSGPLLVLRVRAIIHRSNESQVVAKAAADFHPFYCATVGLWGYANHSILICPVHPSLPLPDLLQTTLCSRCASRLPIEYKECGPRPPHGLAITVQVPIHKQYNLSEDRSLTLTYQIYGTIWCKFSAADTPTHSISVLYGCTLGWTQTAEGPRGRTVSWPLAPL